ncbi:MAG: N-glycosylase/DNA lyase [Thermoplasmata archaeon]|nr:N-glycosylase/DNA lyase [Thermoplasmata archaeon]
MPQKPLPKKNSRNTSPTELRNRLIHTYNHIKPTIARRLEEFDTLWKNAGEERLFQELAFCLFTPQSKAEACWDAVQTLARKDLLLHGTPPEIAREIPRVRFRNHKAEYLTAARETFTKNGRMDVRGTLAPLGTPHQIREWLVANIKGMGMKEASHFLRNIGKGQQLAILDRHILKNLAALGVIHEIPGTLTKTRYLAIEQKLLAFAENTGIPPAHLDLLLWYKETGKVFK